MEYRQLGRTEISVSAIGLGTMTWGQQNNETDAQAQMNFALDHGVQFWDAAEMYPVPPTSETYGLTETFIGAWLERNKPRRESIVLATKAAGPLRHLHIDGPERRFDLPGLRRSLEKSLKRLQTDYVDLYQLHWPSRPTNTLGTLGYRHETSPPDEVPLGESIEALVTLQKEGLIRSYGLSNETPWGVMAALAHAQARREPRPVAVQNPYNLLNRSFEVGLAEIAIREKVGLIAYSPLAMGQLSGKYEDGAQPEGARLVRYPNNYKRYRTPPGLAATSRYVAIARAHGHDPAQMAISFALHQPFVSSVLIGATSMPQLRSNIAAAHVRLSLEVQGEIDAVQAEISNPCP